MQFQFDSIAAFFAMNGHGPYVWACYAITFAILLALVIAPLVQKKSFLKQQKKWQQLQKNSSAS